MSFKDVTIVFCSCDAYSDLWGNFFKLLKKYWPEYDGEIVLNTETKEFQYKGFRISEPLNCAKNVSWSDRLSLSLKKVKTPYVLMFLEDFYLKDRVDNIGFARTLEYMKASPNTVSITYLKEPGGMKKVTGLDGFLVRNLFSVYKMTAHITLYRTDYLQKILRYNENAWEFEVNGTIRSWFKKGEFLCPVDNSNAIFPYDFEGWSLCVKGKYYKPVKEYFEIQEKLHFSEQRETVEYLPQGSGGSLKKKFYYLCKGLLSICRKRSL